MPEVFLSKLTLPVDVDGTITNVEYTIKDADARNRISQLGKALYWMGVTTTELSDGATTNPITIGGESVTANAGGVAQDSSGTEFAFDGTNWQELGNGTLGALAYQDDASASYTPAGNVGLSETTAAQTDTVTGVTDAGTTPYFTVSGETATFNPGAMPTRDSQKTFITDEQVLSASFSGTAATITVS